MDPSYQQQLVEGWEDVFKKSQLTLWILLALKHSPKHMLTMKEFIAEATNGIVQADDKSMYRALRRYHDADMVTFATETNTQGPDRKIYSLTPTGSAVLQLFIQRNILGVFFKPWIKTLLEK